jgi:hypothetical protein
MVIIQLLIAYAGLGEFIRIEFKKYFLRHRILSAVTLDRMTYLWGFTKRSRMYVFMFAGYIAMHAVSVAFGTLGGIQLYRTFIIINTC